VPACACGLGEELAGRPGGRSFVVDDDQLDVHD
jgi:hypothetical protein